ncbi:MAG: glycosyltransferase family 9 protein [bacterium JZ-2024 1]
MAERFETIAEAVRRFADARIGVFVGTPGFGDLVTEVPLYQTLRNEFPRAQLYWIGQILPPWKKFFEIYFPEARLSPYELTNRMGTILKNLRSAHEARRFKWTLILDTQRYFVHSYVIKRYGARWTVGYSCRSLFSDVKMKDPKKSDPSILGNLTSLLKAIGVPDERIIRQVRLTPAPEAQKIADAVLPRETREKVVGIAPWGTHETKRWPPSHWWELARRLKEMQMQVFWFAGNAEREFLRECLREVPGSRAPLLENEAFAEVTNAMGVLARLKAVIANNNGISHLASALNVPTAIVFGPTRPARHKPCGTGVVRLFDRAEPCSPCRYLKIRDCPNEHICMRGITPDEILMGFREWLN